MLKALLGLVAVASILFFMPLLGTVLGAFTGWVVGIVYPETLGKLATWFGLASTAPWQLGAMLGFVGGFFKTSVSQSTKSE